MARLTKEEIDRIVGVLEEHVEDGVKDEEYVEGMNDLVIKLQELPKCLERLEEVVDLYTRSTFCIVNACPAYHVCNKTDSCKKAIAEYIVEGVTV